MHGRLRLCVGLLLVVTAVALGGTAQAAPNRRELQARQEFAAGRYANALELFAQLYAETLHPTYLRNIGRCQQELGDPEKAITSFRQYLSKAKELKPSERQEVEGFIRDMEELKRKREATAAPPPPPARPVSLAVRDPEPAHPILVAPKPEPQPESAPVYGRWWFWALVGAAAVGGAAALLASGTVGGGKGASCPSGVTCQ
jgi:tetratricopeptide (TPR) repeat protein